MTERGDGHSGKQKNSKSIPVHLDTEGNLADLLPAAASPGLVKGQLLVSIRLWALSCKDSSVFVVCGNMEAKRLLRNHRVGRKNMDLRAR